MKIESLENKNILVTGGTRGIGEQIVEDLKRNGANVISTGTHNLELTCNPMIIADRIRHLTKDYDTIHGVVNNAGINGYSTTLTNTESLNIDYEKILTYEKILRVNLIAPFIITSSLNQYNKLAKGASIVNMASISGKISMPKRNAYSASKAGILGLTRSMALDLAQYGTRVNCVSPGIIETDLTNQMLSKEKKIEKEEFIPIGRLGNVKEISSMVCYLLSDESTYITGQNFIVDGGYVIK